jgi:golgi-specific brefeldin A-resistance guanine nucleotide exchange factor 1
MHALVRTIFARLHFLDPAEEEAKLKMTDDDTQEGEIKLTVGSSSSIAVPEANGDEQEPVLENLPVGEKGLDADEAESPETSVSVSPKPECG